MIEFWHECDTVRSFGGGDFADLRPGIGVEHLEAFFMGNIKTAGHRIDAQVIEAGGIAPDFVMSDDVIFGGGKRCSRKRQRNERGE